MAEIAKGLDGIVVDNTSISQVTSETSSLVYRGYRAQELADQCTFEEVAYLLWNGELPNKSQLDQFRNTERQLRSLDPALLDALKHVPKQAHPMDVVRTGVSWLGMEEPDSLHLNLEQSRAAAMKMLAKIPTIIAVAYRVRKGEPLIAPRPELGFVENFFNMCFGKIPDATVLKAFDVSMILYAEHSFNASTFTARVVTSTMADIYSAVVAGIGALKGPLHGGANEAVMHIFDEIGTADQAAGWLERALADKRKIMGFAHRVYKKGDSRVPTMKTALDTLIQEFDRPDLLALYDALETAMVSTKGIE